MTCETCPFFYRTMPNNTIGVCRRNPPTAILHSKEPTEWVEDYSPEVGKNDWCGEHPERRAAATFEVGERVSAMRHQMHPPEES